MNSKEKLAQALQGYKDHIVEQLNNKVDIGFTVGQMEKLNDMIQKAKDGYYSDYDSPLALPCIQLVSDLKEINALALVEAAKSGAFDITKEESDAWYEREGKAMIEKELPPEMHHLFTPKSKEETEAKEGIKGWDY